MAGFIPAIHVDPRDKPGDDDLFRTKSELRRHRAEIVALGDVDTGASDEVVRRRRVELHLQHREMVEVVLALELARLAAHRDRDDRIFLAVDLIGTQPLQEVDGFVDARLTLGEAVVLVGEGRQSNPGDPAGAG